MSSLVQRKAPLFKFSGAGSELCDHACIRNCDSDKISMQA